MKKLILSFTIALSSYCCYAQTYLPLTGGTLNGTLVLNGVPFVQQAAGNNIMASGSSAAVIGAGSGTDYLNYIYGDNPFSVWTNNVKRMTIDGSGNVGIGANNPSATLEIYGNNGNTDNRNFKLTYPGGGQLTNTELSGLAHLSSELGIGWSALYAKQGSASYAAVFNGTTYFTNGNVGIGITNPGAKLHVQADANTSGAPDNAQFYITGNTSPGKRLSLAYNTSSNYGEIQSQAYAGAYTALNLNPNGGNVLIGQATQVNTAYKLDVNGKARANEIVVNTSGADFVFDEKYSLPKLSDVKAYIDKNKHLPEIPSAKEMQANGMSVGEINTKLLQKVEELTLYLIEKDKQLSDQQQNIKSQQSQIDELREQLKSITKFHPRVGQNR
ncbi:MAG TPA: hypothetical protein VL442_07270 [Mucilaginibacter sp.]|jgi:hypothetical protein|nr:hypothetical protein [Mucilaginibacter sp.]